MIGKIILILMVVFLVVMAFVVFFFAMDHKIKVDCEKQNNTGMLYGKNVDINCSQYSKIKDTVSVKVNVP